MFSHILIPTDGSALATIALEKGLALARHVGAKVTVLTVMEPFHVLSADSVELSASRLEYERYTREKAADYLSAAEWQAKSLGVPCETVKMEHEHPYRAIIETAGHKGCELIAMASHGRRGIAALVLGSVTVKVLTHSTIPVLVYR
jgi:nucleotide-binding universal stress UspA family protein